jgi:hypothetical protein
VWTTQERNKGGKVYPNRSKKIFAPPQHRVLKTGLPDGLFVFKPKIRNLG